MKNRLEDIEAIIKTQNEEGYRINNLNAIDMKWLIERAEQARKTEVILGCSDLNDEEKLNNINSFFYNE